MGGIEAGAPAPAEPPLEYHPRRTGDLTRGRHPARGPCQVGSLTGAVASQRVTEARARYARAGRQPAFGVQEHKRARLREGHLGQARKRVLVIRRPGAERPSLNGQKVLRG